MKKLVAFIIFLLLAGSLSAKELDRAYGRVLTQYADAAFAEFLYVESEQAAMSSAFSKAKASKNHTIAMGKDKLGREIVVILYPSKDESSLYVSMIINEDGYIEVLGRGGVPLNPRDFTENFEKSLYMVMAYPGDV